MRIGRLLQAQMRDAASDTPARIAERHKYRLVSAQAVAEREARYPELTPDNAQAAIEWQTARIKELMETA